jgi:hypothetical protein
MAMAQFVNTWYTLLSGLFASVGPPLRDLADASGLPFVSALVLGLIGATAPCQLTTGAGALAYVARQAAGTGGGRAVARSAFAYVAGKVLVYTILGFAVLVVGRQVLPVAGIVALRKALGPAMLLLGLYLLGVRPLHFSLGQGLSEWIEDRAGGGAAGAFVLGTAFSFAFCPTLFLLFFGLTIPMALASPVGAAYPGLFAVGTSLPLLVLAAAVTSGIGTMRRAAVSAQRVASWLRLATAVVLLLAGLNDTLTYWLM